MNSTYRRRTLRLNILIGLGWTTAIIALVLTCFVGYRFLTGSMSGALALFLALYLLCFGWAAATIADHAATIKIDMEEGL